MQKEYDTRFIFRDRRRKFTEVFANTKTREVWFTNFVTNPVRCAFGDRKEATWEDLIKFFEYRCYERHRDDIRDILDAFDLVDYNPFKICYRVNGRAAEDPCWIEFLRWEGDYDNPYESR